MKYAEVFYEVVMRGHDWQPLQPIAITRDGQTISVRFHVPDPPLAWDEAFGAPHQFVHAEWKNGRGFEVQDGIGEMTITDGEHRRRHACASASTGCPTRRRGRWSCATR